MQGKKYFAVVLGLYLALTSCRASFEDVRREEGAKTVTQAANAETVGGAEADALPESSADTDPSSIRKETAVPPEEAASYGCAGQVFIIEEGLDANQDLILQPGEVETVVSECRDEDGNPIAPEPTSPEECPVQADPGSCPANSDDPSQS